MSEFADSAERICVITDYMGDDTSLEEGLFADAGFSVFVAPETDPATWAEQATTATAILTRHAPIEASTITRLERCEIIARYGAGHDNIDVDAARAKNIVVTNVPDYGTEEVADHTMALLLMAARHTDVLLASTRQGGWTPTPLPSIQRLRGKRLGLLGFGRIGAAVAARAAAFGIDASTYDPFLAAAPDGVELVPTVDELVRNADILSLHAPLTPDTELVINEERIGMLPSGAIIVNASRGGLLDLDAAVDAVNRGHLAAVAADVAKPEPLPADHPARSTPGVFLTPHVGYFSEQSVAEAKRRSVEEIIRVVSGGVPENPVR